MSPTGPSDNLIVLTGDRTSLILELAPGEAPLWRYWGPRLPDGTQLGPPLRHTRETPSFSSDVDQPLSLFPTFGLGWFGASALLADREGRRFAQGATACAVEWVEQARAVIVHLTDDIAEIAVAVSLRLDPASDVLTLSTRLTNTGGDVLSVHWLAAGVVPLPGEAVSVRSYAGRHNNEFQLQEEPLARSVWRRENRRGLTSHDCFPGAVVLTPGATRTAGLVFAAHLGWSGNHSQSLEWVDDGRYQWQMGEWLAPGEVRLAPGEAIETPPMLATCSDAGLDGVAQNFHRAVRRLTPWPGGVMRPRPVCLNTWESVYFDLHQDDLMALAESAADLGVERFVLDDGWFHARRNDRAGLGDWWIDPDVFPEGLGPLARHVRALGMEFGLWVEPEMVNPDSDLYRAHPDWALHLAGREARTARNQLVLDLTRPEVVDYLAARLTTLLDGLPIAYLKWDHNRELSEAGSFERPAYRRQTLAAYGLIDALRARHPAVEIEACAGGGGRIDAGILARTHRVWTSDCIDAVSRMPIQRGFLQFFPPELMGSHVGASPAHTTGRRQSLAFRAAVAVTGHFGVELDVRRLDEAERSALRGWIAFYKRHRARLHAGRVWQGDAADGVLWQAHGDAESLLLFVYRVSPTGRRWPPAVRLPMLDPQRAYDVRRLDLPGAAAGAPSIFDSPVRYGGAWLAQVGAPLPALKAERCVVYSVAAV
jgi:alpha-galactosidase